MIKRVLRIIFDNEFLSILVIGMCLLLYGWTEENNMKLIKFFCFWTAIYAVLCYLKFVEIEKELRRQDECKPKPKHVINLRK